MLKSVLDLHMMAYGRILKELMGPHGEDALQGRYETVTNLRLILWLGDRRVNQQSAVAESRWLCGQAWTDSMGSLRGFYRSFVGTAQLSVALACAR